MKEAHTTLKRKPKLKQTDPGSKERAGQWRTEYQTTETKSKFCKLIHPTVKFSVKIQNGERKELSFKQIQAPQRFPKLLNQPWRAAKKKSETEK